MKVTFGEKSGKKSSVYIDGELKGPLYPKEINHYKLEDDSEIDDTTYEKIMKEAILPRAKRYVMNLLIKSDRSEAELKHKLRQAGYGDEASCIAIEYVRGFHYIDELRMAENFIRTKMDYSSEKEIRYKLGEKGINEETIDLAYDEIVENEGEDLELKAAENFVMKKLGYKSGLGSDTESQTELSYEEKNKLMAAAFRKGFRQGSVKEVLKKLGVS